ncbi:MAG: methylmalonyl Co-A mutase-associated GTPase MeaB, partial [Rhodothermales bacterium]|nr:methylmalonyl Co-A mutase-associated GTPase MeaB [Rhodothermales bacterium]
GIEAVWETIEAYETHTRSSGYFDVQRREQARTWMYRTIEDHLRADFFADPAVRSALPGLERAVAEGRRTATDAARALLDLYQGHPPRER